MRKYQSNKEYNVQQIKHLKPFNLISCVCTLILFLIDSTANYPQDTTTIFSVPVAAAQQIDDSQMLLRLLEGEESVKDDQQEAPPDGGKKDDPVVAENTDENQNTPEN